MNPHGGATINEHENVAQDGVSEIPSFPVSSEQFQPAQEVERYKPNVVPKVEVMTPSVEPSEQSRNQESVPGSQMPELKTDLVIETTKSGERIFVNPELGQSTFRGGVTSQQLVSKVAGYYTVQHGLISDPKTGLLQQTATSGDPASASTWQATVLYKILQAFWSALGIS
ncbi:hypothetical protein IT418_01070 [bacterium]|nr:hypothetical protein [bacterium]